MAIVLSANKTKMVHLLCSKGYHPTIRGARFEKIGPSHLSFRLIWMQPEGQYQAYLTAVAGRPYCEVSKPDRKITVLITFADLRDFDMIRKTGMRHARTD